MNSQQTRNTGRFFWLGLVFLSGINIMIAIFYLANSMWVLLGGSYEVMSGLPYVWPPRVRIISVFVSILCVLQIVCVIGIWTRRKIFRAGLFGCLMVLALLEILEGAQYVADKGWGGGELLYYSSGPVLVLWAIFTSWYLLLRGHTTI